MCVQRMHHLTDWPCVLANVLADGPRSLEAAAATANMLTVDGRVGDPRSCFVFDPFFKSFHLFETQRKKVFVHGVDALLGH